MFKKKDISKLINFDVVVVIFLIINLSLVFAKKYFIMRFLNAKNGHSFCSHFLTLFYLGPVYLTDSLVG